MGKGLSFIVMAVCLVSNSLFSKPIQLDLNLSLSVPGDCMFITEGNEVSFTWGLGCSADVIIMKDSDPIPVYRTNKTRFDFKFVEVGEYVVFCGDNNGNKSNISVQNSRVATSSVCFTVADAAVPTLGEWAIINLGLLLLIFSVVHIKSFEPSAYSGR